MKKELTLYERNDKGELIPQEVPLQVSKKDVEDYPEIAKQTIKIVPMTRGQLREMFGSDGKEGETVTTDKDTDGELIIKHCREPIYTADDVMFVKPHIVRSIVKTILCESGIKLEEGSGIRKVDEDADEFGKN